MANEKEDNEKQPLKDVVRELALTGIAAVFMTEDSIRKRLKELKVPKELMGMFMEGVAKKKDDLTGVIGNEVGKMLSNIDISEELGKVLKTHKIHFDAKISFEPKKAKKKGEPDDR